jgi:L-alanine-DL-glutamate epimerase-like enolase superfamily enzyme
MARSLEVAVERFPIAGRFAIARGSRTEAVVVTATISEGNAVGRGECVPYARYGETVEGVALAIAGLGDRITDGLDRIELQDALPAGGARNAIDCALWDLESKLTGVPAHVAAGIDRLRPVTTAYTISLDQPGAMAEAAARAAHRPILKIKLGAAEGDAERIEAVRRAAPDATLIADANEGWTEDNVAFHLDACAAAGFVLIEQPLRAGEDAILAEIPHAVPICADESVHDRHGLAALRNRYDKAGGLTEALALATEAQRLGFGIMVGCMLGSSLAMAPAMLLTPSARFVDLDAPLLLARDREPGLIYSDSLVTPPMPTLWG